MFHFLFPDACLVVTCFCFAFHFFCDSIFFSATATLLRYFLPGVYVHGLLTKPSFWHPLFCRLLLFFPFFSVSYFFTFFCVLSFASIPCSLFCLLLLYFFLFSVPCFFSLLAFLPLAFISSSFFYIDCFFSFCVLLPFLPLSFFVLLLLFHSFLFCLSLIFFPRRFPLFSRVHVDL